jgi:hypothetical protein
MKSPFRCSLALLVLVPGVGFSQEAPPAADPKPIIAKAIAAAGGEAKLLKLFRIKERFNFGEELAPVEKASTRTSVIEPPKYWWLGGKDRTGEPAKFDVWGWSLGILLDPESVIAVLPGVEENGKITLGLQVTGTVTPAMDLHFDPETHRLVRIDWVNDIYRFSDWREHDGAGYQAKTVMFRRASGKPWFYHEILELERLAALPEGLAR